MAGRWRGIDREVYIGRQAGRQVAGWVGRYICFGETTVSTHTCVGHPPQANSACAVARSRHWQITHMSLLHFIHCTPTVDSYGFGTTFPGKYSLCLASCFVFVEVSLGWCQTLCLQNSWPLEPYLYTIKHMGHHRNRMKPQSLADLAEIHPRA